MAEYATPRHDRLFSSVIALWNTPRDHKEDRLRPHEYCMRQRSPAMRRHRNEIFRISSFLQMVFVQVFRLCSSYTCNSSWIVQMWSVSPASIAGATRRVPWTRTKLYHAKYSATLLIKMSGTP